MHPAVLAVLAVGAARTTGSHRRGDVAPGIARGFPPPPEVDIGDADRLRARLAPGHYGVRVELDVDPASAGEWRSLEGGWALWRLRFACRAATSMSLDLTSLHLGREDAIFAVGEGGVGSRLALTPGASGQARLVTPPLPGSHVSLELLRAPRPPEGEGRGDVAGPPPEFVVQAAVVGVEPLFEVPGFGVPDSASAAAPSASRSAASFSALGSASSPSEGAAPTSGATSRGGRRLATEGTDVGSTRQAQPAGQVLREVRRGVHMSEEHHAGCQVNPACPEVSEWADASRGVALVLNEFGALCSGTLINPIATPDVTDAGETFAPRRQLFLTAFHCVRSAVEAPDFHMADAGAGASAAAASAAPDATHLPLVFVFNWKSDACRPSRPPDGWRTLESRGLDAVYGAHVRAYGNDSDFALLEIDEPIPEEYGVRYNGWNAGPEIPRGGVVLHHPKGDLMKAAVDEDELQTGMFGGRGYQQNIGGTLRTWQAPHWYVQAYEAGSTEAASSGAPLLNRRGEVVGVLHGGFASCAHPNHDWFGRLGHMFHNEYLYGQGFRHGQLQAWLDPAGTARLENGAADVGPHANVPARFAGMSAVPKSLELLPEGWRDRREGGRHDGGEREQSRRRHHERGSPSGEGHDEGGGEAEGAEARAPSHAGGRERDMRMPAAAPGTATLHLFLLSPPKAEVRVYAVYDEAPMGGADSMDDAGEWPRGTSNPSSVHSRVRGHDPTAQGELVGVLAGPDSASAWDAAWAVNVREDRLRDLAGDGGRSGRGLVALGLVTASEDPSYDGLRLQVPVTVLGEGRSGEAARKRARASFRACVRLPVAASRVPGLLDSGVGTFGDCHAKCAHQPFMGLAGGRCVCLSSLEGDHLDVVPEDCRPECPSEVGEADAPPTYCGSEYFMALYALGEAPEEAGLQVEALRIDAWGEAGDLPTALPVRAITSAGGWLLGALLGCALIAILLVIVMSLLMPMPGTLLRPGSHVGFNGVWTRASRGRAGQRRKASQHELWNGHRQHHSPGVGDMRRAPDTVRNWELSSPTRLPSSAGCSALSVTGVCSTWPIVMTWGGSQSHNRREAPPSADHRLRLL